MPRCFSPYIVGLYYTVGLQAQALVYFIVDTIYVILLKELYFYLFMCMFVCAHVHAHTCMSVELREQL